LLVFAIALVAVRLILPRELRVVIAPSGQGVVSDQ